MLSFNNLGNLGRLANQMFQYASLKGIAINRGYEYCIPPNKAFGVSDLNVRGSDVTIYDCFDLSNVRQDIVVNPIAQESCFHFDKNLFNNCSDNVDLFGYFQSEKYFKHIENDIRKDFSFKEELKNNCKNFINALKFEVISLHVRRGDYLINPNHPVQSLEYYEKALKILPQDIPVLIFSDDSDWCFEQKIFNDDRFLISSKSSSDADLCMMSLCDYHIIANSSFSWWGAWLGKSKQVIAPKKWFGGQCINNVTKDLYCSDWIIL